MHFRSIIKGIKPIIMHDSNIKNCMFHQRYCREVHLYVFGTKIDFNLIFFWKFLFNFTSSTFLRTTLDIQNFSSSSIFSQSFAIHQSSRTAFHSPLHILEINTLKININIFSQLSKTDGILFSFILQKSLTSVKHTFIFHFLFL